MKNLNMFVLIFFVTMIGGVMLSLIGGEEKIGIMIAWTSLGLMLVCIASKIDNKGG